MTKVVKGRHLHPGVRYGGRKKGTPNKSALPLREIAERMGVNPFEILLRFAHGDWKGLGYEAECYFSEKPDGAVKMGYVISPEVRAKCAAEATQYLEPKRKAIEHTGANGGPIETRDVTALTDEQIQEKIQSLLGKVGMK